MKWLKRLGWFLSVIVILFALFSLVGSVVVSYQQTGQPPGDPGPTPFQIVDQGYIEILGRLPSGQEVQLMLPRLESGEITNGNQLREAIIKSSEENK